MYKVYIYIPYMYIYKVRLWGGGENAGGSIRARRSR